MGRPIWTSSHFTRAAAQDDLGIEALGAGLLRELVPGVVQTSISAGYYAYYPFLLDEFQRRNPDELRRSEFKRFYRRQEAAFAVACADHKHRGNLRGINGINGARTAIESLDSSANVDLERLSAPNAYMKTALGGYGLFYRPALEDVGATRLGAGRTLVDRVAELGEASAEGFRSLIENTTYWREWADSPVVPLEVLRDLGEVVCPCNVPGRPDHQPIVDILFGTPRDSERSEALRQYRVNSLGLLLEFQHTRPDEVAGIGAWRRAIISGRIGPKSWDTAFPNHREAWRAYQYRETLVAALTTVFSCLLAELAELQLATAGDATAALLQRISWDGLPVAPGSPFEQLISVTGDLRAEPDQLITIAERAMDSATPANLGDAMASALYLLGALATMPDGDDDFLTLLDRGGEERLSPAYLSRWLQDRKANSVYDVYAELVTYLFHRHLRVGIAKLTITDHRDPFCVNEVDDGRYQCIRPDEPFWTGARFTTLNHLLWTAGALDEPDGDGRPTDLGLKLLQETQSGA